MAQVGLHMRVRCEAPPQCLRCLFEGLDRATAPSGRVPDLQAMEDWNAPPLEYLGQDRRLRHREGAHVNAAEP